MAKLPTNASEAAKIVTESQSETAKANLRFFDGDHWQDGNQWIGPRPSNSKRLATVLEEIRKGFVSHNTIKEVVTRAVSGLLGKEAVWRVGVERPLAQGESPSDEEQGKIDVVEAMLTNWWDEKGVLRIAQAAMARMLLGKSCAVRMYVPEGRLVQAVEGSSVSYQLRQAKDVGKALDDLFIHVVDWENGNVFEDSWSMRPYGLYVVEDPQTHKRVVEMSQVLPESEMTRITLMHSESGDDTPDQSIDLDLRGNLPMKKIALDAEYVTPQMVQQQNLQNLAFTMMGRNVVLGGFLERVLINAQMPGKWVADAESPGGEKFVPEPLDIGAGIATNLVGVETIGDDGKKTLATPSIAYRDPVPIVTFADTIRESRNSILEEASQLHVAMSGDATSSGESRIQARADFATLLLGMKSEIDGLIRWVLETAMAFGNQFAPTGLSVEGLSAMSNITVNTGPLTLEERKLVIEMMDKGKISEETGMAMLGVEDVDFEKAAIRTEWSERLLTPDDASKLGIPAPLPDQLPEIEERMGIPPRDVEQFKAELAMQAEERMMALKESTRALPDKPSESDDKNLVEEE